jgi:mannose-6-phosphate isomerase-like protein (cupin superfamily)
MKPFDLMNTFVHLKDGGDTMSFKPPPFFWQELAERNFKSPETKRVGEDDGWLITAHDFAKCTGPWEMHPLGDEILFLITGELDVEFENKNEEHVVQLKMGMTCVVPKGIWHRQIVKEPGMLLGITYGKNTQHRPL